MVISAHYRRPAQSSMAGKHFSVTAMATDYDECLSCPDCEYTEQCTDECHVVSCDDPAHDGLPNLPNAEDPPTLTWDFKNCPWGGPMHCPNFERFVHTEYFPELRSGHSPASRVLTLPYDPNAPILLPPHMVLSGKCPHALCSQSHSASSTSLSSLQSGGGSLLFSNGSNVSPTTTTTSPPQPMPSDFQSVASPEKAIQCQWSNCSSSFESMNQLVAHVNEQHLCQAHLPPNGHIDPTLSFGSSIPSKPSVPTNNDPFSGLFPQLADHDHTLASTPAATGSCLWKDCNLSPSSIPLTGQQSSTATAPTPGGQRSVESLLNHLLQDHLGVLLKPPLTDALFPLSNDGRAASPPPSTVHSTSPPSPSSTSPQNPHSEERQSCRWRNCGMTFPNIESLNAHINERHVGAGKAHYDCLWEGCNRSGDKGFSSKQKVCRHIQTHTGHKPFLCQICQQSFSEAATLQQHMRRHTKERPCVCDFPGCGKAFSTTGALTIHKRVHNGHKPFKCHYCDKAFAESSNLAKHLRTHTGEKPYQCPEPQCGKAFARPDQLTRHLAVHKKKR